MLEIISLRVTCSVCLDSFSLFCFFFFSQIHNILSKQLFYKCVTVRMLLSSTDRFLNLFIYTTYKKLSGYGKLRRCIFFIVYKLDDHLPIKEIHTVRSTRRGTKPICKYMQYSYTQRPTFWLDLITPDCLLFKTNHTKSEKQAKMLILNLVQRIVPHEPKNINIYKIIRIRQV